MNYEVDHSNLLFYLYEFIFIFRYFARNTDKKTVSRIVTDSAIFYYMKHEIDNAAGFSPKRKLKSIIAKYDKYQKWFDYHEIKIDVHEYRFSELEDLKLRNLAYSEKKKPGD